MVCVCENDWVVVLVVFGVDVVLCLCVGDCDVMHVVICWFGCGVLFGVVNLCGVLWVYEFQ